SALIQLYRSCSVSPGLTAGRGLKHISNSFLSKSCWYRPASRLGDVDQRIHHYNHGWTYSDQHRFGKTPIQALKDSIHSTPWA
ncbi:MAG: hypothetical protein V4623_05470, partial [Pseudomonadota bacterium]